LHNQRIILDNVVNSPSGKDRVIQEYERRLKAERNLVQTLQVDYDESSTEIAKLKTEIENLKEKLER
jgi:predicted RNase H-like nuclease (RuvC/YqgF family)